MRNRHGGRPHVIQPGNDGGTGTKSAGGFL
jgi:hypothetical protein